MSERLSGWGRTAPAWCDVLDLAPDDDAALRDAVAGAGGGRGVLGRGAGRCYGDAAQNSGGAVVRLGERVRVDPAAAVAHASGGTPLAAVQRAALPHGLALPVVPGTRHVTVGGAVAADVHGKNHLRRGSLGGHLREVVLLDGTGRVHRLAADGPDPDAFWATVGGMGLTGLVLRAELRLEPVATAQVRVDERRAGDLDALLAALDAAAAGHEYAVAWVDALPRRRGAGRGIVSTARSARVDELAPGRDPLAEPVGRVVQAPPVPRSLVGPRSVRAFNAAWWARPLARDRLTDRTSFLCPLDGLGGWNRLYGPAGFVQHQVVVPDRSVDVLRDVLQVLGGCSPFLGVLKRFGPADPAPLSFPRPGWSLALDLPSGAPGLAAALDRADLLTAAAGGAVYLAKDAALRPELVGQMYPRLGQWREVQGRLDPDGRLRSDLDRRLELVRRA